MMRVYLPATFGMLKELHRDGAVEARRGWGFAVTPALTDFFTSGDDDEIAHMAFLDASRASLRLLAGGGEDTFPHRRVVLSVDVDEKTVDMVPDQGESVVRLTNPVVPVSQVAAIHVDIADSESATAKAIEVVDAADLGDEDAELTVGDALDNFLAWYDPIELPDLVTMMEA